MKGKVQIDASEFSRMTASLSRISGASQRDVIRAEALAVLNLTASRTKRATLKKIRARHLPHWEKAGDKDWHTLAGKIYYLHNKLPDAVFAEITKISKAKVKALAAQRGWAKKGWYVIGRSLGLSLDIPAYAVRAEIPNVSAESLSSGYEVTEGKDYTLVISNRTDIAQKLRLGAVINTVLRGRMSYFQSNVRKGVFKDIKEAAEQYKGITFRGS